MSILQTITVSLKVIGWNLRIYRIKEPAYLENWMN